MHAAWGEYVRRAASDHAVRLYASEEELAESVGAYLAAGFESGEPAVVIATPEHTRALAERLERAGWTAAALERDGLLTVADAEGTLARLLVDGAPARDPFEELVGGLIDRTAARFPGRRVRAFGEMVDLLYQRGERGAAIRLEELWNELRPGRRFSLLCAYAIDVFDRDAQAAFLPHACDAHTTVFPAASYARLVRSVERALDDVVGRQATNRIYLTLARETKRDVPMAQLLLMWVSRNMPEASEQILAAARSHYAAAPA